MKHLIIWGGAIVIGALMDLTGVSAGLDYWIVIPAGILGGAWHFIIEYVYKLNKEDRLWTRISPVSLSPQSQVGLP